MHVERWKHLNHYITVNIYIEILGLFSSLHCLFFYIDPEMGGGGRFGERFKMSAHSPFWSSREFFMITWPIQTLSSVPVFLDNADGQHHHLCHFFSKPPRLIILRCFLDNQQLLIISDRCQWVCWYFETFIGILKQ